MEDLNRKMNYLLTQPKISREHITFLNWLISNTDSLNVMIQVTGILKREGITVEDLVEQITFGNEFRALQAFYSDFLKQQNQDFVGTEVGTFIFANRMLKALSSQIARIDDDTPYLRLKDFSIGLIIIPLSTVIIRNTRTDVYFNQHSDSVAITVLQNRTGPLFSFVFGDTTYRLQGTNPVISNMQQLDSVIQQRVLMLPYHVIDDNTVELYNMEADIDITGTQVLVRNSFEMLTMPYSDFVLMATDLPRGVRLSLNIFTATIDSMYKQVYVSSLLQELLPQAITFYHDTYMESLATGLYGQGMAVSISQLYTLAESTLRREEVKYRLNTLTTQATAPIDRLPTTITSPFTFNFEFTQGTVWGLQTVGNFPHSYHWNQHPISIQAVDISNERAVISDTLNSQRIASPKILITKTTSIGTEQVMSWFEERHSNITNIINTTTTIDVISVSSGEIISPNDWKINGIAGGIMSTELLGRLHFYGLNLQVHNRIGASSTFELRITRNYRLNSVKDTYMILVPEDLASDSTTIMRAQLQWTYLGVTRDTTANFIRQRIEYGDVELNAYVGLIRTESVESSLSILSTVRFDPASSDLSGGFSYASNDLINSNLNQTHHLHAFDSRPGQDPFPVARTSTTMRPQTAWAASVRDDPDLRTTGVFWRSPPLAWQDWGTGGIDINYTSCYLSVSNQLQSIVESPLSMLTPFADMTLVGTNGNLVPSDIWGYQLNVSTPMHWTTQTDTATIARTSEFSPILGFNNVIYNTSNAYQLRNFSATVIELLLPSGIYNQFNLAESTINNRRSIELLIQYANYLRFLLTNLEQRLSVVESTMENVIDALNAILDSLSPSHPSTGAQMLNFLGTSIGMFFPLTGLAINIAGQMWSGAANIQDGNLLVGSMDIITGSLMSILGVRKFKQRMDRKYGATSIITPPQPPSRLPSYDELFGKPGYNAVGKNILPKNTTQIKTSSGVIKSSTITWESQKTAIHTILYQQGLYDSYTLTRSRNSTGVAATVDEIWDDLHGFESITYGLFTIQHDVDGNITKTPVTDSQFSLTHGTRISKQLFVKYLFAYANIDEQVSETLSYDPEVFFVHILANLSLPSMSLMLNPNPYEVKYLDTCNINRERFNLDMTTTAQSVLSLSDFADAMDPYITSQSERERVLDNIFDYLSNL